MPFTPFHMGAALIAKPVFNRHFSVITFGIAQIVMDIEPGIGMLTGAEVLHGPTHTILGALGIAFLVSLISPSLCKLVLKRWNKEIHFHRLLWLELPEVVSKATVIFSALFGTLSHVALDSLMHFDMHPLAPFSQANPLIGLISHDEIYQLCLVAGILGAIVWLILRWTGRAK